MTEVYDEIESKYGFAIPPEYREMEGLGWFDPRDMSRYLYMFEMEWWRPAEILNYQRPDYHKPGFVPFASTGAGDHWCWWPAEGCVVLCPHDCLEGEVDAPNLLASIYRRILEYASGGLNREDESGARQQLLDWSARLSSLLPGSWLQTVRDAAAAPLVRWERGNDYGFGFITHDAQEGIVKRDLNFPRVGEKFEWMYR